jgi:hypothetical protein
MNTTKYVGMGVHQSSTSIAVLDERGKLCLEKVIETRADPIRGFLQTLSGTVYVTLKEGTLAGGCPYCLC